LGGSLPLREVGAGKELVSGSGRRAGREKEEEEVDRVRVSSS
jgi:hypothetical protein